MEVRWGEEEEDGEGRVEGVEEETGKDGGRLLLGVVMAFEIRG